jgi:hypothetical protein
MAAVPREPLTNQSLEGKLWHKIAGPILELVAMDVLLAM